jgi:hypothetical protein
MKSARAMAMHGTPGKPVPPHYRGVWRRTLLQTPEAIDTGTTVLWLQTSRWHADIRLPEGRPDFSGIRSIAECSPLHIDWLARQQGFAGITDVSRDAAGVETCQWHRLVDFQPPPATPDAGTMRFDGDDLTETGIHARYLEAWRRLPDSTNGHAVLQLQDTQGRPASPMRLLLVAGEHVMHVRGRTAPWPANVAPGTSLAALVAMGNVDLLDIEISYGQRNPDGWTVVRSTLPWLENTSITIQLRRLTDERLEVNFGGEVGCWEIGEWTAPVTRYKHHTDTSAQRTVSD